MFKVVINHMDSNAGDVVSAETLFHAEAIAENFIEHAFLDDVISIDIIDTHNGIIAWTWDAETNTYDFHDDYAYDCELGLEAMGEDEYPDDYDECGYNPYMGCYDYDC